MNVWYSTAEVPKNLGRTAVTIGKFDGVHLGHLQIVKQLNDAANRHHLTSVVVAFDRHPAALLDPDNNPVDITGFNRRLELLSQANVDATLVLRFDRQLASLTPEEFVSSILVDALHVKLVAVGTDFKFGHKAAGTIETLRELGKKYDFEVEVIDDLAPIEGRRASSSWIRQLMAEGDVALAAKVLGRLPGMAGEIVHGEKRGRELGFPTANFAQNSTGLIPADGIYAGWFTVEGIRYPAAISVGTNPTFEGKHMRTVEAHVLDQTFDLYGKRAVVEFAQRLRGMEAYNSVDELIAQMNQDCDHARVALGLAR